MMNSIRSFFSRHVQAEPVAEGESAAGAERATPADPDRGLHIAACALLLELAYADSEFAPEERQHIEEALTRHFDLPAETARELITLADQEREEATDLYQFTSLINQHYDEGQRMVLAEVLWRVVYADGKLSRHEDYLMQKLARLLELRPGYLAAAKKRVAPGDKK